MNKQVISHPTIKIVAIAKDEAAYISEWVHHHLYFGFDAIEVHINRTTDNSAEILTEINHNHKNVSWQYADWIDICPGAAKEQIQFIVYAQALEKLRQEQRFTHVLFLDIDEFWFPHNMTSNIKDYISSVSLNNPIFFEWLNDLGELPVFSHIQCEINGNLSPLGKTLLPINTMVKELRHHVPLFCDTEKHLLANGDAFKPAKNKKQELDKSVSFLKQAFIYHRAHRSAVEYVSLLFRGRPGNDFGYKNNRTGLPKPDKFSDSVNFEPNNFEIYQKSLIRFEAKLNIVEKVKCAQSFVLTRYQQSIENMGAAMHVNYLDMMKIFRRVHVPEIIERFTFFREKRLSNSPNNANLLRDFANDAAHQNLDEAIRLMKRAHKLRPKGPQIKMRLAELEQKKRDLGNSVK
jgi:hypothetical protein